MKPEKGARELVALATGGGLLAGGQIFEMAARLGIAVLLTRSLGPDDYGLYVIAISVAAVYSGVSTLGLDRAMVRYVAILSARRDNGGLWGALQIGFWVSGVVSVAMGTVLFVLAETLSVDIFDEPALAEPLRVMAVIVPFLTISNVLRGVAHGFRRMGVTVLAENVVQTIVRLGLLAGFVLWSSLDLTLALLSFGASDLAASVVMIALLKKTVPHEKELRVTARRDTREIFRFAVPLWLSGMLRQFRRNIQVLLLGALSVASDVALFAVAASVNLLGRVSYLSILAAVKPIVATLHDQGKREELARVYLTATRWTFSFNIPFFVVVVFLREPILEVFGAEFAAGSTVLLVLAGAELANAGTGICNSLIDMTGHARLKLANSVVWMVIQVGGAAILIPRWGVMGAAASSFLAIVVVNVVTVVQMLLLEDLWPYDRTFWKPLAAGLGAAVTGIGLAIWLPAPTGIAVHAIHALTICGVYAGLLASSGVGSDERFVLAQLNDRRRPMRAPVVKPTTRMPPQLSQWSRPITPLPGACSIS